MPRATGMRVKKSHPWTRRTARIGIAVAVGIAAVAAGFVARIATNSNVAGNRIELELTGATKGTFVISSRQRALERGIMRGLFPGATEKLVLTISNPNSFRIVVRSITVDARDASASCGDHNLVTKDYIGPPVSIPRNGRARVSIPISMRPDANDSCQGATFPLVFGGTATKK